MTRATSLFLDSLRACAALTVFVHHCSVFIYANAFWVPGHAAVVVFFVLSGYVIAYSTLGRRSVTAKQYVLARLARLYSVVIPALILTALLFLMGKALHLAAYDQFVRDYSALRFAATALFLQSVWWRHFVPPGNVPFWSLGYEFWYYAIFGCVVFIRNWSGKVISVLVCGLAVGSNILLLFPIWLLGVSLYLYGSRIPLSRGLAIPGFICVVGITAIFIGYLPEYPEKVGTLPMMFSASFLTDSVVALGVGLVIWFFEKAWGSVSVNPMLQKFIQWPAHHSFSLYLFHAPLLIFFSALGIFNPYLWWSATLEIGLILIIIFVLSEVTESKRKPFEQRLDLLWTWMERGLKG